MSPIPIFVLSLGLILSSCASLKDEGGLFGSDGAGDSRSLLRQAEPAGVADLQNASLIALAKAEGKALDFAPVGERVRWQGKAGQSGTVTASAPFRVGQSICRRLSMNVRSDAEISRYDLTACKRGKLPWRLVR